MVRHSALVAVAILAVTLCCASEGISRRILPFTPARVPLFSLRARVTRIGGHAPENRPFTYRLGRQLVRSKGSEWSPWLDFTRVEVKAALHAYPNLYLHRFPVVLKLNIAPVTNPTSLDVQIRFEQAAPIAKLHAELLGHTLGILLWRSKQSGEPRAATMAGYNQRYWSGFSKAALQPSERPKHFLIADRFIGGDNDLLDWQQGISHLASLGINTLQDPPGGALKDTVLKAGFHRFALGAELPGGPLGFGRKLPPLKQWASRFAARTQEAGYSPSSFSLFAIADEPGWYFPAALHPVENNPDLLETFHHYLASRHLTPSMLGATTWQQIHPIGHGGLTSTTPLPTRRLFYWTCRFFPWYVARHMRDVTSQLHQAFSPKLETFSNFNNFADQSYFEGFRAHNPNPRSPDAAMEAPRWFEFGRMHGADLLWTEDWFGNSRAYQWSYYAAKLRSIAYRNGLKFGGYVVGRSDGKPQDGIEQKVLALVGNGAKAVFYYVFGPEYNFPGNCYSGVPGVPTQIASADGMIAKAESLLWPGRKPAAQVAILQPSSSGVWDGLHIPTGSPVVGVTNTNPNGSTLDYMAEEYDEYLALEMSDVPVDFVSESELADGTLDKYKVLYITEPDIPGKDQRAVAQWVKNGGTLVMVPGAAQANRYDEPAHILTALAGNPPDHQREYVRNLREFEQVATLENVPIFGEPPDPAHGGVSLASFDDHSPAISEHNIGRGHVINYSWFPGLAYAHRAFSSPSGFDPDANAELLRKLILKPVRIAGISPPVQVNVPYVETPVLESPEGAAVTLLNWTGHDLQSVKLKVRVPFHIASVISVTHGKIALHRQGNRVTFSLPLGAADIVELRR